MAECPVCAATRKACKKLGNKKYCDQLIKELYADKITVDKLSKRLQKKFGNQIFDEIKKELGS